MRRSALGAVRAAPRRPADKCRGKYNCPLPGYDLPWMYDDMAGDKTSRLPEPELAATGCLDKSWGWSGCCVSARRHLPATAPGRSSSGRFSFARFHSLGDEPADRQPVSKTGQMQVQLLLSSRASRTGLIIDTSIV